MAVEILGDGNPDGTSVGRDSTELVGFHGSAAAQAATTTAPASTAATNSSPYGFSQAQANAIKDWIIAVDAALKAKGIVASS